MLDKIFTKIEKFIPARWRWILDHEGFKRYFSNTSWMFAGQILSLLVSFFIGAWVARYLGAEKYGQLSYAISFAGLFGFIATLGIDSILSRELVSHPEKRDELLGTSFGLKIGGGILAFLITAGAALLFEDSWLNKVLIIIFAGSFILQAINVISIFFQAEVRAKNNIQVQIAVMVISSLLKVALILAHGGVLSLIVVYVLDFVWQGLGFIYVYKKAGQRISAWHFKKELAWQIVKQSRLLLLSVAAGLILARIDQVMVGRLLGQTAVGFYAVAVKIAEVFYFIPAVISGSLFPAIINAKKISPDFYRRRLRNFYGLMGVLAVLAAVVIFLSSRLLIIWLFGAGYEPAIGVLRIYVWAGIGSFMSWAVYQHLLLENRLVLILIVSFLAMLVNIVLNLFFIPIWGLRGAALATLISYFMPLIAAAIAFQFPRRNASEKKDVAL